MNIAEIAKKFAAYESAQASGTDAGSEFGVNAWAFVFRQLTFADLEEVNAKGPEFIFADNSSDSLWEEVQELLNFWEEWSYGELCEALSKIPPSVDALVWEWMIQHMAFDRKDYEFCSTLLSMGHPELCGAFFHGSQYGHIANDPGFGLLSKVVPEYDFVPLYDRLDSARRLWATAKRYLGENWKSDM